MALFGMVGSGSFSVDERPKNWREKILQLDPNGQAPITAITSKMTSEATDDAVFNWFDKDMASQAGTVTDVWTNAGLSTAYVSGGVAGNTVYVQVPLAFAQECVIGKVIRVAVTANIFGAVVMKVMARVENGASSYLTCKLLQADTGAYLASATLRAIIIGSMHEEGAQMPNAVSYSPTKRNNYTQIHRTPLSITRTAKKTRLRTGKKYDQMKKEALFLHGVEIERASIFGVPYEGTGAVENQPERSSGGLIHFASTQGGVLDDYRTTEVVADGTTWAAGGEEWMDEVFRQMFKYGRRERLALIGDGVTMAIHKLIKKNTNVSYQMTSSTSDYGLAVTKLVTPFGVVNMMTHPLFTSEASLSDLFIGFDPQNLIWRYIDDTAFYKEGENQNTGYTRKDSTDEEFLTEAGFEIHHPKTIAVLTGFGSANVS